MTPRTRHFRQIRAGVQLALADLRSPGQVLPVPAVRWADLSRLGIRAYTRARLSAVHRSRRVAIADLVPLHDFIDRSLAAQGVGGHSDRAFTPSRVTVCCLEFRDHSTRRPRLLFFVTTPDIALVDEHLPMPTGGLLDPIRVWGDYEEALARTEARRRREVELARRS